MPPHMSLPAPICRRLDNGMPVYIDPTGTADVAAVYLWMDVGSRDEGPGMEGAAHFVEHLVFKGTASYEVGGVARAVEGAGGDLNAWTSFDETVFHATGPASSAPGFVTVLAEMARTARMDPDELERERLVVAEEIRARDDDPEMLASEALYGLAFGEHPYGRPIIGLERTVKAMDRGALRRFYEAMYAPSNACLAVVGPVDVNAVMAAATAALSGGAPRPARLIRPSVDLVADPRTKTLRTPFSATLVEIAWRVPGQDSPRTPVLDTLAILLGGGASAPLDTRLRRELGVCLSASASLQSEADGGVFVISLDVADGKLVQAIEGLRGVLTTVQAGVGPAELARAKAQILADRVYSRESVEGRAHQIVFHDRRFGDITAGRRYDAAVAGLDAATVTDQARLLDMDAACMVVLEPKTKRRPAPVATGPHGGRTHPENPARPAPAVLLQHARRSVTLENGTRILLQPDASELAAVRVVGVGGHLLARPSSAGRVSAWSRMVTRGTENCPATDFAGRVEQLAAGMSSFVGRSSQGLRADVLAEHAREALLFVCDVLVRPAFDGVEFESVRAEMLEELEQADDEAGDRLSEAMWSTCFPRHPWSVKPSGSRETIKRIRPGQLHADHFKWACGKNLVVVVAGDFDPEMAERVLRHQLGRLPMGAAVSPTPTGPWGEAVRVRRRAGWEQTHIAAVWPGLGVQHPDSPALEIMSAALGSQGGRLFDEVREKRGLAYGVGCSVLDGIVPGVFSASLATDPAKAVEAERAMLDCIQAAREGLEDVEIERARQQILGGLDGERQHVGSRASAIAYHVAYDLALGVDVGDPVKWARRRYEIASPEDVRRVAGEVLSAPCSVFRVDPKRERTT